MAISSSPILLKHDIHHSELFGNSTAGAGYPNESTRIRQLEFKGTIDQEVCLADFLTNVELTQLYKECNLCGIRIHASEVSEYHPARPHNSAGRAQALRMRRFQSHAEVNDFLQLDQFCVFRRSASQKSSPQF